MKAFLAALAGSALSALISTLALTIYNIVAYDGQSLDFLNAMFWFMVLAFLANALTALTIGMFWHAVCQKLAWTGAYYYWPLAGLIGGLIPAPLLLRALPLNHPDGGMAMLAQVQGFVAIVAMGICLGGLTALFAWLIRRPDRDPPNPPTSSQ